MLESKVTFYCGYYSEMPNEVRILLPLTLEFPVRLFRWKMYISDTYLSGIPSSVFSNVSFLHPCASKLQIFSLPKLTGRHKGAVHCLSQFLFPASREQLSPIQINSTYEGDIAIMLRSECLRYWLVSDSMVQHKEPIKGSLAWYRS